MTQQRYDTAEFMVNNKEELLKTLEPDLFQTLDCQNWFIENSIRITFDELFEDLVQHKITWMLVDQLGISIDEAYSIVTKNFIADLFGEEVLQPQFWDKRYKETTCRE